MKEPLFKIAVVEDNEWYNKLLVHNISLNPEYTVDTYHNGKDFLEAMHHNYNVVTLDYKLPDMLGEELLGKIKSHSEETEVIVISEQENIETAVDLLKAGAYDYIVKAKDIRDRLLNTIQNIRKNTSLK